MKFGFCVVLLSVSYVLDVHSARADDWGGWGIRLTTNFDPAAESIPAALNGQVVFDCATGTIDQVLSGGKGDFTASGTFTAESGGPVRPDHLPEEKKAHYIGSVNANNEMLLIVIIDDALDATTIYHLKKGDHASLHRCE